MDAQKKKYFVCGGVLLSLGIVSAALLSCVNLFTAPAIESSAAEKIKASYLQIFPSCDISEKNDLSESKLEHKLVDYYVVAYNEKTKLEEGKIFHGSASGHDGAVEILVGFASVNKEAKLQKISLVSCNESYKNTFTKNYLDPVNEGKKDYNDLTNIGATVTSKAVKKVVSEAEKLFISLLDKTSGDNENNAAFADVWAQNGLVSSKEGK